MRQESDVFQLSAKRDGTGLNNGNFTKAAVPE